MSSIHIASVNTSSGSETCQKPEESRIVLPKSKQHHMICVDATKFAMRKTAEDCTLRQFCTQCAPSADIRSMYREVGDGDVDVQAARDVILMHKVCE